MVEEVFERFGLEPILTNFEQNQLESFREVMLATKLRLTPFLSPRLFGLLDEVKSTLGFDEAIDLFVSADAEVNAYAIHTVDETPHIIGLTSSLIERLSDTELRFVLGHEIGHLAFRHYRAKLVKIAFGEATVPPLLERRLVSWGRLAEISADRAGHAAAGGDLQSIVATFFKLESGLGPEHVRFDIGAFLGQLSEIQQGDRSRMVSHFSHPLTPIRVRSLQLFAEAPAGDLSAVDEAVKGLADLMEVKATSPLEVHGRDFLLAAGVLLTHGDGEGVSDEEHEALVEILLPLMPDPEQGIAGIANGAAALESMERSAAWLRENAGEERFAIFRLLARIAAVDGSLKHQEEEILKASANLLGIPANSAKKIQYEILTANLQARRTTGPQPGSSFDFNSMATGKD
jgi:uncharacterized tellurite resistance protein B-like protein